MNYHKHVDEDNFNHTTLFILVMLFFSLSIIYGLFIDKTDVEIRVYVKDVNILKHNDKLTVKKLNNSNYELVSWTNQH